MRRRKAPLLNQSSPRRRNAFNILQKEKDRPNSAQMEQMQTKQRGSARRLIFGVGMAVGIGYLVLILATSILRGAARREGEVVVRWIETTKQTSGSIPERVVISTRFSWSIQAEPRNNYRLLGCYLPFARVFWIYSSGTGQWVDDRDN